MVPLPRRYFRACYRRGHVDLLQTANNGGSASLGMRHQWLHIESAAFLRLSSIPLQVANVGGDIPDARVTFTVVAGDGKTVCDHCELPMSKERYGSRGSKAASQLLPCLPRPSAVQLTRTLEPFLDSIPAARPKRQIVVARTAAS